MKNTKLFLLIFLFVFKVNAQKDNNQYNSDYFDAMTFRNIGPHRGGRSCAVAGVPEKPNLFYMGNTGGGIWKTTDAGNSWKNISDGYFGGSVGAISVSEWDNNVIYVGMGEKTVRGNVSSGDGVWKSEDGGRTWKHSGLKNSRHISRIRIHPKNPDIVYAAVMGDLFKPTSERGVYKSTNRGKTWKKTLFANSNAGAVDLIIDPNNPRILFATTWNIRRTPYSLSSGGEGSALWKSTDAGETWKNISTNNGLPDGVWGISGVTVSPLNSDVVWALIENKNGGVYKSNDGGKTWSLINNERKLRQRAWYYTRIYADTKDVNTLYVLNVNYHRSTDGGKTYKTYSAPHGDHHDLWIDPYDNQRMIIADDGGAQISFDAGENWSTYLNQPTSQFYRVTTDNHFPYRIYGAQQDNTTIRITHRNEQLFLTEKDYEKTAGGESAHIAVDPLDNDIVYGGSYGGLLTRKNHRTGETRAINIWPDDPMGHGAEDFKYRFQWNFPLTFSPNNPKKLYAGSNQLHVTTNQGQSWQIISPDLTKNNPKTLKSSGGPITQDNTGVEYYGTIFALAEVPKENGVISTGSDAGLVHITKDGGKNWTNITPKQMPEWMMINCIEINPHIKGGAYIVGTKYKSGDYKPYIYRTEDYGKSWKLITKGIDKNAFTRALRADPKRKGLLYAGTEKGMYISFDNGKNWQNFQLNLPIVPITDLAIKNDNLIVATQGRSFWIIDDLTPLHQIDNNIEKQDFFIFKPKDTYRMSGGKGKKSKRYGENHYGGVSLQYYLKNYNTKDTVSLSFYDKNNKHIKTFSNHPKKIKKEEKLKIKQGSNIFHWDMMYLGAEKVKGMILWWATLNGPKALPGTYNAVLSVNEKKKKVSFNILKKPNTESTIDDLTAQFNFINDINKKMTEIHKGLKNIKKVRKKITSLTQSITDKSSNKNIIDFADQIVKKITKIENNLYQTKSKSIQDPLNYPIKLNNKLGHLNSLTRIGDYKPTDQEAAFKEEIILKIDQELNKLYTVFEKDVKELNNKIKTSSINFIELD